MHYPTKKSNIISERKKNEMTNENIELYDLI